MSVKLSENASMAERVAALPEKERLDFFKDYSPEQLDALQYDWKFWGRKNQFVPEGDWHIFAICAGRGFGKSRTLSEWVREKALKFPGCRIAVVARTSADARDTMVLGESGILAVHHPDERPEYKPSVRRLDWPNGSQALLLSAESPDQARGTQFDFAACDEYAAWPTKPDASGATMVSNIITATRLGDNPQLFIATTPKRTQIMKDLIADSKDPDKSTIVVSGSTLENKNLSKKYITNLLNQYGDSDLARQEIGGEMLDGAQGLVFTDAMIEMNRIRTEKPPKTRLQVIAVDPTVAAEPRDECGIVVIGATQERDLSKRRAFILDDVSLKAAPDVWAQKVVDTAKHWGITNIVIEKNQGGDMCRSVIHAIDPTLNIFQVTATKGKMIRAEPVVVAMQQKRVKFWGDFPDLEDQMIFYDPALSGYSPDRMDAMVWGITATLIKPPEGLRAVISRISSAVGMKLPDGRGTGKTRKMDFKLRK